MAFFSRGSFVVLGWSLYLPYVRLTGNKAIYFRENLLTWITQEILGPYSLGDIVWKMEVQMTPPRNGLKRSFLSLVLEKRWRVPRDFNDLLHQGFSQICLILDAQSQVEKQNVFGLSSNDDGILQNNIVGCTLW